MSSTSKINSAAVLGMKNELYKFITVTLIVVDVCIVSTITYFSINRVPTFFLYISFPILAIIAMKTMEKTNKTFPFIIFCSICPLLLGSLIYFSGANCPAWLTALPLVTISLFLIDSVVLKFVFLILYAISLVTASLLIKIQVPVIFAVTLGIAIYSAVLARCLNYFQIQQMRIESQKKIIEEKNEDIIASINYAKRIQQALMPTEKYISKNLDRLQNGN